MVGFSIAYFRFHVVTLIDYDSGQTMRVFKLGPFVVREEMDLGSLFTAQRIAGTNTSLHGKRDWHAAAVFYGNSRRGPYYEGGSVRHLFWEAGLGFERISGSKASQFKRRLLEQLVHRDFHKMEGILRAIEAEANAVESKR